MPLRIYLQLNRHLCSPPFSNPVNIVGCSELYGKPFICQAGRMAQPLEKSLRMPKGKAPARAARLIHPLAFHQPGRLGFPSGSWCFSQNQWGEGRGPYAEGRPNMGTVTVSKSSPACLPHAAGHGEAVHRGWWPQPWASQLSIRKVLVSGTGL